MSVTFEMAEERPGRDFQVPARHEPYEFQHLVADLLRAMSYHVSWVAPPGKDGGVDILAWPDALGTSPPRIKVQVKRQQTREALRAFGPFMAVPRR